RLRAAAQGVVGGGGADAACRAAAGGAVRDDGTADGRRLRTAAQDAARGAEGAGRGDAAGTGRDRGGPAGGDAQRGGIREDSKGFVRKSSFLKKNQKTFIRLRGA